MTRKLIIIIITSWLYEVLAGVITCSNSELRRFITSTIYSYSIPLYLNSSVACWCKKVHFTHNTSQHPIGQRMKRLPWADVIPLVTISSARLISHRHLRCHWPMHLIVIVRVQWASAGIFPVRVRLAGRGCWRHGPASWSEWEAGLKRGVGPERETGEGAPRSSEQRGVGPANRILRLDRFLHFFFFLLFVF